MTTQPVWIYIVATRTAPETSARDCSHYKSVHSGHVTNLCEQRKCTQQKVKSCYRKAEEHAWNILIFNFGAVHHLGFHSKWIQPLRGLRGPIINDPAYRSDYQQHRTITTEVFVIHVNMGAVSHHRFDWKWILIIPPPLGTHNAFIY